MNCSERKRSRIRSASITILRSLAVVCVAALFPLSMHRQRPISGDAPTISAVPQQTAESDAALLADIDQDISADVPAPMQPLADPTAGTTSATSTSDQRSN